MYLLYIVSCHNYMYYVCETQKMQENVVKHSEFGYTREQRYTKVIYYYYALPAASPQQAIALYKIYLLLLLLCIACCLTTTGQCYRAQLWSQTESHSTKIEKILAPCCYAASSCDMSPMSVPAVSDNNITTFSFFKMSLHLTGIPLQLSLIHI